MQPQKAIFSTTQKRGKIQKCSFYKGNSYIYYDCQKDNTQNIR